MRNTLSHNYVKDVGPYRPGDEPHRYVRATVLDGEVNVPRLSTVKATDVQHAKLAKQLGITMDGDGTAQRDCATTLKYVLERRAEEETTPPALWIQ